MHILTRMLRGGVLASACGLVLLTGASANPADQLQVKTPALRQFQPASVRAAPDLACHLHAPDQPPATGVSLLTDSDGYVRFHALKADQGARPEMLTCTDGAGKASTYPVDLSAAAVFQARPLDLANEPGIDRPPLSGDPSRMSQAELAQQGYGLRPAANDPAYPAWLEAARRAGRMLMRKSTEKRMHAVTVRAAPAWIGSVMTGSAPYTSITASFVVPTALPGAYGTTTTEASLWPGLGGFGTGSGLIQAGITLQTTATTAAYGSWREYCCGDGDSNGYGGAFVPAPGDKIFAQAWYCDSNGAVSLTGGFGCSYLLDFRSGAVFSCTKPRGTPGSMPCWSVAALPLCSVNPTAANCMTLGGAAEFILENQSGQLSPPTDQFPPFQPAIVVSGSATGANGSVTVANDPAVTLLIDYPHAAPHVTVALNNGSTSFTTDAFVPFFKVLSGTQLPLQAQNAPVAAILSATLIPLH